MNKLLLVTIAIVAIILSLGVWLISNDKKDEDEKVVKINNFQECIEAGNPAMESYPRQCRAGDQTFTEYIGNELEKTDLIFLDSPRPNQTIKSPL
ncbi:hypothetical protein KAI56_03335, partial [Candidatus Parcubacteria bacterium]|nr:hypothetical protein [Candidatus Parcubacteria bacterium]